VYYRVLSVFAILGAIFLPGLSQALEPIKINHQSFIFELPPGWVLLNRDGRKDFENFNFYNGRSDVIQFSVSKDLSPNVYAIARGKVQAEMKEDKSRVGWKLIRTGIVKLPPYGDVDESVYVDNERPLTSYSYNVYGKTRIALFTITFNRSDLSASEAAQTLVKGLRWK